MTARGRSTRGARRPSGATVASGELVELTTSAPAAGGDALAREATGRVVFVRGALPGERIRARLVEERADFAKAELVEVHAAAPGRVHPPCPLVAHGCGGCDLQHASTAFQRDLKRMIVVDALRRLGRLEHAEELVEDGPVLPTTAFRTTVRAGVADGRAGFRAKRSHAIVPVDACLVAHPVLEALLARDDWGDATELTMRVGSATGDVLVEVAPSAAGLDVGALTSEIEDRSSAEATSLTAAMGRVQVVGHDEVDAGRSAWYEDVVAGHRFRISARSFFQSRSDGAAALVGVVRELGGAALAEASVVVDAYGGVGLFAAAAVPLDARLVLVESNPSSVDDARHNLRDREATVVGSAVEDWEAVPADVVIADPARVGLGAAGVTSLAATGAPTLVLVSCDPASLGRDARLLAEAGYRLERTVLVDLFPHTHHVEAVTRFTRSPG